MPLDSISPEDSDDSVDLKIGREVRSLILKHLGVDQNNLENVYGWTAGGLSFQASLRGSTLQDVTVCLHVGDQYQDETGHYDIQEYYEIQADGIILSSLARTPSIPGAALDLAGPNFRSLAITNSYLVFRAHPFVSSWQSAQSLRFPEATESVLEAFDAIDPKNLGPIDLAKPLTAEDSERAMLLLGSPDALCILDLSNRLSAFDRATRIAEYFSGKPLQRGGFEQSPTSAQVWEISYAAAVTELSESLNFVRSTDVYEVASLIRQFHDSNLDFSGMDALQVEEPDEPTTAPKFIELHLCDMEPKLTANIERSTRRALNMVRGMFPGVRSQALAAASTYDGDGLTLVELDGMVLACNTKTSESRIAFVAQGADGRWGVMASVDLIGNQEDLAKTRLAAQEPSAEIKDPRFSAENVLSVLKRDQLLRSTPLREQQRTFGMDFY